MSAEREAKRMSAARTALILDHPFFGALALRLEIKVAAPEITRTLATDGRALYYAPAYTATLKDSELVAALAHEVMHLAMQHHTRRGARDVERWNKAGDLAVNPLLADSGFTLGPQWLIDPQYKGMSAEQIYNKLPTPPPKDQDKGGNGKGNGKGKGAPAPAPSLADIPGAVIDAPEPAKDAGDWQVAVKQATQAAQMMGKLPGALKAAIEETARPVVDWRALLRRFVQQCASADYSWRMPNRRYIANGLYLPELRSESMPRIDIVIDTSGSITPAQIAEFRAEVSAIADECAPESVRVIYCDSRVQHVDVFARGEEITMTRHGGGGTAVEPAFDYVAEQGDAPACLVYLTDGCIPRYPKMGPDYPVLWAMTTARVAPWGETVRIEEEVARAA